ncbi:MAG: pyridoxamine 5'-phosphate oxidase family protein [Dehalococcoidales bacterium]|nr:pyridoxamine 5'-phosphate oxidase family protein [Dehalococcoidales bacterium]
MADSLTKRVTEYMSRCPFCTIATVSADGKPSVATVYFGTAGMDIYFNTGKDSQKVRNIQANPRVAIAMQEPSAPKIDREIRGIQYTGKARILSDAETTEIPKAVMARHRAFNNVTAGNSVVVKVTPVRVYLIDYSLGFRHRELLQF